MGNNRFTLLSIVALMMIFVGLVLWGLAALPVVNGEVGIWIDSAMAHWPQLERAPSLKGLRSEVGGMPLPDGWSIEKLPKAGLVLPCSDDEATRICYVMADGSTPDPNKMVDMAKIDGGKYMFLIQKGGGK